MRTPLRTRGITAAVALSLVLAACGGDTDTTTPDGEDAAVDTPAQDEDVAISFLTHWPPETVALLEDAIADYEAEHDNVSIDVRAVPFGDLLTTVRAEAGGSAS